MAVQYTGHMIQTETSDIDTALPFVGVLVKGVTQFNINFSRQEHQIDV